MNCLLVNQLFSSYMINQDNSNSPPSYLDLQRQSLSPVYQLINYLDISHRKSQKLSCYDRKN